MPALRFTIGALAAATLAFAQEPPSPAELFAPLKVWTMHLRFTAEEWVAMEPKRSGPGLFGGRGPGGRPGGFGPATQLAPSLMKDGDADHDGGLSKEEWQGLSGKLFSAWEKDGRGQVNADQVRAGLTAILTRRGETPPAAPVRGSFLQGAEGKRNGLASAMGIEFAYVHADLQFDGMPFANVAVRYKGNGTFMESRGSLKRSLKIDLNKYKKGQKLAGVTTLNLHNNVTDSAAMNEVLAHSLYRAAGVPAPRTAYARVFVTVPDKHENEYLGLYSLVEDIDPDFIKEQFGTKKGAVFKPVTPSLFSDLGDGWPKYQQTYDPKTELSANAAERVIQFSKLVTHASDAEFAEKLGEFVELEEFARFMAVTVFLSDIDGLLGPGQNFYLHLHPKTQRFAFIPWDQDHSWGQFPGRATQEQFERLSIHKPWQGENRFLDRVFKVGAFKARYVARLDEFSKTIFKPEHLAEQVDEIAAAIRPAVQEESDEKLVRFDQLVAGKSTEPNDSRPFGGGSPAKPIKPFSTARAASLIEQVNGTSQGLVLGSAGFGGGPPRGGGGPGGPPRPGPGGFLAAGFVNALDSDKDGELTRAEFSAGFGTWFTAWNTDGSGVLSQEQLRAGLERDLAPPRGGPPGSVEIPPPPSDPRRPAP